MQKRVRSLILISLGLTLLLLCSGCTYFKDRGSDALDMMDLGITVNDKLTPQFALYVDFFSLFPVGASSYEGNLAGMGDHRFGIVDLEQKSWGALVWGSEKKGSGEFNPEDPYQARPDQRQETERLRFNNGFVRLIAQDNDVPALQYFECDKFVHVGWIGVYKSCHLNEIFDFVLGWTTIDFMGDDELYE